MVGVNGLAIGWFIGIVVYAVIINVLANKKSNKRFREMRTEFFDRIMNTKEFELENKSTGNKKVFIDKEEIAIIQSTQKSKEAPNFLGEYLEKRKANWSKQELEQIKARGRHYDMGELKTQRIDTEEYVSRLEQRLLTLEIALDNFKNEVRKKISEVRKQASECQTVALNAEAFTGSMVNNTNAIDGRLCAIEAKLANQDDGK